MQIHHKFLYLSNHGCHVTSISVTQIRKHAYTILETLQFNIIPLLNKLPLSYRSILRFAFEIKPGNFLKL